MIELVITRYKETIHRGQLFCANITLQVTPPEKQLLETYPLPSGFAKNAILDELLETNKVTIKSDVPQTAENLIAEAKQFRDRIDTYVAAAQAYGNTENKTENYPPKT